MTTESEPQTRAQKDPSVDEKRSSTANGGPTAGLLKQHGVERNRSAVATAHELPIYRDICESMTVGVMLMGDGGRIKMLNPAAAALLGVELKDVLGRHFAEAFIENEELEEFNEAVLTAMYDGQVGHQSVANIKVQGERRPLSVATCYLRQTAADEDGSRAVVALFTDISEIEQLRSKELELIQGIQDKHRELGGAYRDLEQRNRDLQSLLRKMRAVRMVGAACVLAMIVGVGAYAWNESPTSWFAQAEHRPTPARKERIVTLKHEYVSSTIQVSSSIEPRRKIAVNSPITGRVENVLVKVGDRVEAGDTLIELDVSESENQLRNAQATYLNVKARVDELADWDNSLDASRARRSVTKARIALDAGNEELAEQNFLFDRGLTPLSRLEAARRDVRNRELDFQSTEQDLKSTLKKGKQRMGVARLDLENAQNTLKGVRATLEQARVVAPVAGVVLEIGERSRERETTLTNGTAISNGDFLLSIGDMDGITATGWVDEVEVQRVRPAHKVRITGPAFPRIELHGTVTHVSSQAFRRGGQQGLPKFELSAVVDQLNEAQRAAVRLGMSAKVEIVVYENNAAIMVPLRAVSRRGNRGAVTVRDPASGEDREVNVKTGATTPYKVEIVEGLEVGQMVVVP